MDLQYFDQWMRANPRNSFFVCFIVAVNILLFACDTRESSEFADSVNRNSFLQGSSNPNKEELSKFQNQNLPAAGTVKQNILAEQPASLIKNGQSQTWQKLGQSPQKDQSISQFMDQSQDQQQKLKPWIHQEIQHYKSHYQSTERESFSFILDPESLFQFKWASHKKVQLLLSIRVFRVLKTGGIIPIVDSEEYEFIDIQMMEQGKKYYASIGQVYVSKKLTIAFNADIKHFRFVSRRSRSVLVMVQLQRMEIIVQSVDGTYDRVKDEQLSLAARNLQFVKKEVVSVYRQLEYTEKCNQSYLNNQIQYQSQLLGHASVEVTMIVGSTLLQLFLIKKLITHLQVI